MNKEILLAAKECFESNPKITADLHVTSDLFCFEKAGDAKSHSHSLKDETVIAVTRDQALAAKGSADKPEFTVAQMVEKFAAAKTADEVDALIAEGETRKGVADAAAARKVELSGA